MQNYELHIDSFIRRVYRLLDEHPHLIDLKKIRGAAGEFNPSDLTIKINYQHDIISVLIHECIHFYYPKWSETKVLKHEAYLMRQMGHRRAVNLLKRFAAIL